MPYRWTTQTTPDQPVLILWPHRSLPRRGFAAMILFAFTMGTIPLYGLLGSVIGIDAAESGKTSKVDAYSS